MAALDTRNEIDFGTLRDVLETNDSALSKAISHLEQAAYVKVIKGYTGNRPRTWVVATSKGAGAFRQHILAIEEIARPATNL